MLNLTKKMLMHNQGIPDFGFEKPDLTMDHLDFNVFISDNIFRAPLL